MSNAKLDKVIEEVKALAPDELQEIRALVDSLLTEPAKAQMTEDEFEQYLAAKGIISLPQFSDEAGDDDDDWEPVEVTGQPLSKIIIEERR
jgi:hypothetical protein